MSERTDAYTEVTDRVLAALERGTVPWRQPWTRAGRPRSMSTGKPYRGINTMLLGMAKTGSPWWGTYRQIQALGGQVRRGEKSTMVTFWKELQVTRPDEITGEPTAHRVPMLRIFRVFCADQADALPSVYYPAPNADAEPIMAPQGIADAYLAASNAPAVRHDVHGQAYYSPADDVVHMAPFGEHRTSADYYSTLFHELSHATGHLSRLNRLEPATFGSHAYGREELTAQWSAALLNAECGIAGPTEENSPAYIASWIATIKADRKLVISAAAAGQRAADMILAPSVPAEHDVTGTAALAA